MVLTPPGNQGRADGHDFAARDGGCGREKGGVKVGTPRDYTFCLVPLPFFSSPLPPLSFPALLLVSPWEPEIGCPTLTAGLRMALEDHWSGRES